MNTEDCLKNHEVLPPIHNSDATAYLVDDYPYGFTLRCKIRYWLEFDAKRGFRFCSQTTNPKVSYAEIWNKPKKSTYCWLAGIMLRNLENSHITWTGLTEYNDIQEIELFLSACQAGMTTEQNERVQRILEKKRAYEAMKATRTNATFDPTLDKKI